MYTCIYSSEAKVGGGKRVNDGDGDVYKVTELGSTCQKSFINPVTLLSVIAVCGLFLPPARPDRPRVSHIELK